MENKFKIDLSSDKALIVEATPTKLTSADKSHSKKKYIKKKKIENLDKTPIKSSTMIKIQAEDVSVHVANSIGSSSKKKKSSSKVPKGEINLDLHEKPKLNINSTISLTNLKKEGEKVEQKLSYLNKQKPRQWEKRWVLFPNVFEFSKDIWLKQWVQVDGREDLSSKAVSSKYILAKC